MFSARLYHAFSLTPALVPILKSALGRVVKILDDNFGILQFGTWHVLFDTCDVWKDQVGNWFLFSLAILVFFQKIQIRRNIF
jgi:hypothetical protein